MTNLSGHFRKARGFSGIDIYNLTVVLYYNVQEQKVVCEGVGNEMKKLFKNKDTIYWFWLVSYLTMVLVFLLLISYVFVRSQSAMRDEMIKTNTTVSHLIRSNIYSMKNSLDILSQQLTLNKLLLSISNVEDWSSNDVYLDIKNLSTDLNSSLSFYDFIEELCIYYPKSDKMIINGGILNASRKYKDYFVENHISADGEYAQWKKFATQKHAFQLYSTEDKKPVYFHSIFVGNKVTAVIIITLKDYEIENIINLQGHNAGNVILLNNLDEPVYFLNSDAVTFFEGYSPSYNSPMDIVSVNDERFIVFSGKVGSKTNFIYYVPEISFMEDIKKTFYNMYSVTGIFVLIGVGLSLFFSGASYKPHRIAREKYNKASFDLMLSKYLYGTRKHPDLTELFSVYNLTFSFRKYFVALISINDIDDNTLDFGSVNEYGLIESAVSNVIDELIGVDYQSIYVYLYENILFCLTGTDITDEDLIENAAKAAFSDAAGFLFENLHIDFTVYVSGIFTDLDDVRNRYNEVYDFYNSRHGIKDIVIFCNKQVENSASKGDSDKAEELVNDVAAYVEQHYANENLNVNAIGVHFNLSPNYISSLFKQNRGDMLRNYISEVRMKNAKEMLSLNVNIDEVAKKCGFSSTRSFRRAFNRHYGIPPSEYKKAVLRTPKNGQ